MKAKILAHAPALAAILAIAVLWTLPVWATTPGEGKADEAAAKAASAKTTVTTDEVRQLATDVYTEGVGALQAGKLWVARAKFRAALNLDPNHTKAKVALARVEKKLGISGAERIQEKLAARIPEVHFREAPLREVVEYLARQADVNIVFNAEALKVLASTQPEAAGMEPEAAGVEPEAAGVEPDLTEDGEPAAVQPGPGVPGFAQAGPPPEARTDLITIHLKNVPLKAVLRYVLRYKGLRYMVEDYAIIIVPIGWEPPEDMEMEVFRLATGTTGGSSLDSGRTDQPGF